MNGKAVVSLVLGILIGAVFIKTLDHYVLGASWYQELRTRDVPKQEFPGGDFSQIDGVCDPLSLNVILDGKYSFVGRAYLNKYEGGEDLHFVLDEDNRVQIILPSIEEKMEVINGDRYFATFHIISMSIVCRNDKGRAGIVFLADEIIQLEHESEAPPVPIDPFLPIPEIAKALKTFVVSFFIYFKL